MYFEKSYIVPQISLNRALKSRSCTYLSRSSTQPHHSSFHHQIHILVKQHCIHGWLLVCLLMLQHRFLYPGTAQSFTRKKSCGLGVRLARSVLFYIYVYVFFLLSPLTPQWLEEPEAYLYWHAQEARWAKLLARVPNPLCDWNVKKQNASSLFLHR